MPIEVQDNGIRVLEQKVMNVDIPLAAQDVVRPTFSLLRPLMALSRTDRGYRFAWLTRNGIAIIDAVYGGEQGEIIFNDPILTGVANGARLRFSRDGEFLILTQQDSFRSPTKVRIWKIGDIWHPILKEDELTNEACRIAQIEDDNASLEPGLMAQMFGGYRETPCKEPHPAGR
jgi:hypothetical protein